MYTNVAISKWVEKLSKYVVISIHLSLNEIVFVVAKVNWRLMYTLAPNFEANVYISPKL